MPDELLPNPAAVQKTSKEIRRTAEELMKDAKRLIDRSRELRERADLLDRLIEEHRRETGQAKSK